MNVCVVVCVTVDGWFGGGILLKFKWVFKGKDLFFGLG